MAQRLDTPLKTSAYPWDEWTDGSAWKAKSGEDFTCSAHSFRQAIYRHASQRGFSVQVVCHNDGAVSFQFKRKLKSRAKRQRPRPRQRACA